MWHPRVRRQELPLAPRAAPAALHASPAPTSLEWSVEETCAWVAELGFPQYAAAFRENHIDGASLGELGKDDLAEIGVASVGHRLQIMGGVRQLCGAESPSGRGAAAPVATHGHGQPSPAVCELRFGEVREEEDDEVESPPRTPPKHPRTS